MKVKILVAQHKPCVMPKIFSDKGVYVPIQGGRRISPPVDNTIGDDTGENISDNNKLVNEYTVLYWAYKNISALGDIDYIGLNHYRRYFRWNYADLSADHIVVGVYNDGHTVRDSYALWHDVYAFDLFCRRMKETVLNCDDARLLDAFVNQCNFCAYNMFIMSKAKFLDYGAFMCRCYDLVTKMHSRNEVDLTGFPSHRSRQYGYFLERMTGFWLYMQSEKGLAKLVNHEVVKATDRELMFLRDRLRYDIKNMLRKVKYFMLGAVR